MSLKCYFVNIYLILLFIYLTEFRDVIRNLKQPISIEDIGRSHPIVETKNGKIYVIARFLSYRKRQLVYDK
jgi:hypothetical protein